MPGSLLRSPVPELPPRASGDAEFVVARTPEGEMGILADHEPVMASLAQGLVSVDAVGGERIRFEVEGGCLQVLSNQVTLITDRAVIMVGPLINHSAIINAPKSEKIYGCRVAVARVRRSPRSSDRRRLGRLARDLSHDLGVDAGITEEPVRHRLFDIDHPEQQGHRIDQVAVTTFAVAAGALERLLEPARCAHASGEERGASAGGAPPGLPWLMDSSAAEPVERVGSERPPNRRADLFGGRCPRASTVRHPGVGAVRP
ncbi:MAG: F0F1 ATP synthase subunit epsilon [Acidimicrobiia bacterium]|nr:F0F1 ATP synthase subunit epsilon [Acidimicrobiia bacterium]